MELYHLQTFVAVADQGSITGASRQLHLTPPTVSGHIKALEAELALSLFTRKSSGMVLTPEGDRLRQLALETLDSANRFLNRARELRPSLVGRLSIGLNAPPEYLGVSRLAARLKEKAPHVGLTFKASSSGRIIRELSTRQLDAGYIFGPSADSRILLTPLGTADLRIAVPRDFPSGRDRRSWPDLTALPWICSDHYCPFQEIADTLFERQGIRMAGKITANDETTKISLVKEGVGATLLLAEECREPLAKKEIAVWDAGPIQCELYFACPADTVKDKLIKLLIQTVSDTWYT